MARDWGTSTLLTRMPRMAMDWWATDPSLITPISLKTTDLLQDLLKTRQKNVIM
jgi:hypothetical protein